jgi:phage shock protein C
MNRYREPGRQRIYRSRTQRVFFGVCGGLAEHVDFNPWAIRLIVVLVTIVSAGIFGPIIYLIAGVMMREEPQRAFVNTEDEDFWNLYKTSRSAALHKVQRRFDQLAKRIERIESIVTSPRYGLDEEYRKL